MGDPPHKTVALVRGKCLLWPQLPTGGEATPANMAQSEYRVTIKRYAGRRLYDTSTGAYVTVDDLLEMTGRHERVVVYDAATGEDITDFILSQKYLH